MTTDPNEMIPNDTSPVSPGDDVPDASHPIDPEDPRSSAVLETRLADVLVPVPLPEPARGALRERLVARARSSKAEAARVHNVLTDQGEWRELAAGVRVKMLHESAGSTSVLVDIAPGGSLPTHQHHEHEECVVLRGSAELGDVRVAQGDYHIAPAGSRHGKVGSREGALLYLRGVPIGRTRDMVRDLVTAWLPGKRLPTTTVRANEGEWSGLAPGVQWKNLWTDGAVRSMLVRVAPGTRVAGHGHPMDEECLVLEGDLYSGGTTLRAGDYQYAAGGSRHGGIASDAGALLFVRGPAGCPLGVGV